MGIAETSAKDAHFRFLSSSQFETLSFLAEAIVPGSSKARAADFIDLLLSVEKEKNRREFADSLSAFEAESAKRYGKKVAAVSPADLNEMLKDASSRRETDGKMPPLGAAFANLKEWISGAYYSSEIGMRELGWTPDRVFSEFPGCTHSDHNS